MTGEECDRGNAIVFLALLAGAFLDFIAGGFFPFKDLVQELARKNSANLDGR